MTWEMPGRIVGGGGGGKYADMSMTEETYFWLRKNGRGRGCPVWGCKGSNSPIPSVVQVQKPIDSAPSGRPLKGGLQLVRLDTTQLKDRFLHRLNNAVEGEPFQAAFLHKDTNQEYASHVLAEEKQIDSKGKEAYVQIKPRNDLLDCEAGNFALAFPEWPGGGVNVLAGRPDKAPPKKRRVRNQGQTDIGPSFFLGR